MAAKAHGKGRQKRPNNTTDGRKKKDERTLETFL